MEMKMKIQRPDNGCFFGSPNLLFKTLLYTCTLKFSGVWCLKMIRSYSLQQPFVYTLTSLVMEWNICIIIWCSLKLLTNTCMMPQSWICSYNLSPQVTSTQVDNFLVFVHLRWDSINLFWKGYQGLKSGFWQLIPCWSSGLAAWLIPIDLGFKSYCCLIFQIILKLFQTIRKKSGSKHKTSRNKTDMLQEHRSPAVRSPGGIHREIVPPRETVAIARVAIAIVGRGGWGSLPYTVANENQMKA